MDFRFFKYCCFKRAIPDGLLMRYLTQDLVSLVNGDQPTWLVGLTEMTRTFGIELLENILSTFFSVFFKVALLISLVCYV